MIASSFLKVINNLTIGDKIGIGLFLVLVILSMQSIFISEKLTSLAVSITSTTDLTANTTVILDINKNITELQRSALVYGQSGNQYIITKMKNTYQKINADLNEIKGRVSSKESLSLLESMITVVNRYGESIDSLQQRHQSRKVSIEQKMPEIYKQGIAYLKSIIAIAKQTNDAQSVIWAQSLLQLWLEANMDALSYLQSRQYYLKKNVYSKMDFLKKASKEPIESILLNENFNSVEFAALITKFRETFDQSILANRHYLSLVNVVMAGEALEFTILSDTLRTQTLELLEGISSTSQSEVNKSIKFIHLALIVAILLLLLIVTFYNLSITKGIKGIATTFGKLVKGDYVEAIPGLGRRDEIGQLAHAANAFKMVSENYKEAQLIAEKANRHKSEFLANMSHEIRTPINGIIGTTQLLLETEMSSKQKAYVGTSLRSAESLLNIVNDILDFSKIEAGKLELETIPFDLQSLCEDVTELMSVKSREKNLEILLRYKPGTPVYVNGDPGRIRQILFNIISNAIKFTEKGYVLTTVGLKSTKYDRQKFVISVEDTGIGIADEIQTKVFNKFDQADSSTTRKYGGTGLGLSISQQLTQMMNGDINIESETGVGTTFSFTLELGKSDSITPSIEKDYAHLRGLKALIIDSREISRNILMEQLAGLDLDLSFATSGDEAMSALCSSEDNKSPFDLVLIDSQLPDMTGEDLIRKIKLNEKINQTVILYMASFTCSGEGKVLKELGVEGCLSKPIYHSELTEVLSIIWDAKVQNKEIPIVTEHQIREMKYSATKKPVFIDTHILVTEDNPINQMVASEFLEGYGCKVSLANNGKEALEMWQRENYDLILMDCQMPLMDGLEASSAIREKEKGLSSSRIPIVAFTANAMHGDKEKCLTAGMDDYITKPIVQQQLMAALQTWLPHKLKQKTITHVDAKNQIDNAENCSEVTVDSSIIDCTIFTNLNKLFKEKFPAALELHNTTLETNVRKALQAVDRNDCQALSAVMHSIKSSSRQFGALKLGELSESIEKHALDNNIQAVKNKLNSFVEMHENVIKTMQNLKETTLSSE